MIPWEPLGRAPTPNGGELRLMRRGSEIAIFLDRDELMNSRRGQSEEALATLACARLGPASRVLIGGLGLGFTLRAALSALGPDARITVAELVPAVVAWARGPIAELHAGSLADGRVGIHVGDVGPLIASSRAAFDAILIDVDNGPEGIVQSANSSLYSAGGLGYARRALRPRGILAIWSAVPDDRFAGRFTQAGFRVEEIRIRAHGRRSGPRHVVWLGTRTG